MKNNIKLYLRLISMAIIIGAISGLFIAVKKIIANLYFHQHMTHLILLTFKKNTVRQVFYALNVTLFALCLSQLTWFLCSKKLRMDSQKIKIIGARIILVLGALVIFLYLLKSFGPFSFSRLFQIGMDTMAGLFSKEISLKYFALLIKTYKTQLIVVFTSLLLIPFLYRILLKIRWGTVQNSLSKIKHPHLTAFILLVFLAALTLLVNSHYKIKSARPNIILIFLDALRPDHLGCYGYERNTSPIIDKLAQSGVVVKNVFAQGASTYPSVRSCLTSQYAHNFFIGNGRKIYFDLKYLTLAEIVNENGYYAVGISSNPVVGKSENTFTLGGHNQGFNFFDDSPSTGTHGNWQWRSAEIVIKKACDWLNKLTKRNFFLFLYIMDPHDPYHSPEPYNSFFIQKHSAKEPIEKGEPYYYNKKILRGETVDLNKEDAQYLIDLYDGEIRYVDAQIALLLERLKNLNLLENTLIILTSDHGEEFLEHGGLQHTNTLYNELIRIPLVMFCPRFLPQEKIIDNNFFQSIDIVPTILDIVDIDIPATMQGKSMFAAFSNNDNQGRDYAFSETPFVDAKAFITKKWKYIHHFQTPLITPGLSKKYTTGIELYDLEKDPQETVNVYAQSPAIAHELFNRMSVLLSDREKKRLEKIDPVFFDSESVKKLKTLGYLQ